MNIALWNNCKEYFLTNDNLKVGDKVFPLVYTTHRKGKVYITGMIGPEEDPHTILVCTGWPSEPHTIKDFYDDDGIQWVHTDKGYSPAAVYFKPVDAQ